MQRHPAIRSASRIAALMVTVAACAAITNSTLAADGPAAPHVQAADFKCTAQDRLLRHGVSITGDAAKLTPRQVCYQSRIVLRYYVRGEGNPQGWRCRVSRGEWIVCRRGDSTINAYVSED